MLRETLDALRACLVTFVVCSVAYPAVVFGIGHTLFPRQAEGSLIERDGKVIGSELIAQPFASDKYFQPRPSAAGANGYAADAASGSNLGSKNPALADRIAADVARQVVAHDGNPEIKSRLEKIDSLQAELKAKNDIEKKTESDTHAIADLEAAVAAAKSDLKPALVVLATTVKEPVPVDLVTTSGSGLDPDISPEAAEYQVARVASARGADVAKVRDLIARHTGRSDAIIGAPPRVNVLMLNLDLDREIPARPEAGAPKAEAPGPAAPTPTASAAAPSSAPGRVEVAAAPVAAASTAFRALASSHPDDARLWYYAALANGSATNQWRGETEDLVKKGADREKAGTPAAAEIDAAFADVLPTGPGRDWLNYYRPKAAKP